MDAWSHDRGERAPLRVVVLTCSSLGFEMARVLAGVPTAQVVAVCVTPLPRPASLKKRLKTAHRYHGLVGVVRIQLKKLGRLASGIVGRRPADATEAPDGIPVLHFRNFHDADCLAALEALNLDLAVVDGTYVLKEPVFALPRLGSLNIHCGRLPEYRGAPPGFWELYNGEHQVGVTIHQVTAQLDEGPIYKQMLFPLSPVPDEDPMQYIDALWRNVLRPNGLHLMAETVDEIARGAAVAQPQGASSHPTYRRPDYRTQRELRARIAQRRIRAVE